jgi:predicted GNAT superfamily acetyltransferase
MADASLSAPTIEDIGTPSPALVALNNVHAAELSFLTPDRFAALTGEAFLACRIGDADALLLAFDQAADYDSPNFLWFRVRFGRFVYVDRIVVAASARGGGLARQLYEALFDHARAQPGVRRLPRRARLRRGRIGAAPQRQDGPLFRTGAGRNAGMSDARRHAPATTRNREPIAALLRDALPATGTVLEVASGSGEHAIFFAGAFPGLTWIPSDPDPLAIASIRAWAETARLPNLRPPLQIDAAAADWPIDRADALLCINMLHISPWEATVGLMAQAGRLLPTGAPLILYGPYIQSGIETAPSNLAFDQDLRARDGRWGLRALDAVVDLAGGHGLRLDAVHAMPANNLTVVLRKG